MWSGEWRLENAVGSGAEIGVERGEWSVKRKFEWKLVERSVEKGSGELRKWPSGGGECRVESGKWRLETGGRSDFVVCAAYHVMCDTLHLHAVRVACLHAGLWTPSRFSFREDSAPTSQDLANGIGSCEDTPQHFSRQHYETSRTRTHSRRRGPGRVLQAPGSLA